MHPEVMGASPGSLPEGKGLGQSVPTRLDAVGRPRLIYRTPGGTLLSVSATAYFLLQADAEGWTSSKIVAELARRSPGPVTEAGVNEALGHLREEVVRADSAPRRLSGSYWFHVPLLPEGLVNTLSGGLQTAFSSVGVAMLMAFILAGVLIGIVVRPSSLSLTGVVLGLGYLLFLVSVLGHELGHASASKRFGIRPGPIGFTLYLVWPSLYSDVSESWLLSRKARVMVDLGGVMFQCGVGALYVMLGTLTGSSVFWTADVLIAGGLIMNLNPLLRFDGYWVACDALGVTDLSRQGRRFALAALNRVRGRKSNEGETAHPLWFGITTFVLWVLSMGFIYVIMVGFAPVVVHSFTQIGPLFQSSLRALSGRRHSGLPLGEVLSLVIGFVMLWSLLLRAVRAARPLARRLWTARSV